MHTTNLENVTFGRLTVIRKSDKSDSKNRFWTCKCECGGIGTYRSDHLRQGRTKSCGCLNSDLTTQRNYVHGYARRDEYHPLYNTWMEMRQRCNNPNNTAYGRYGGRGIIIDPHWDKFENFAEDMGERPSRKHSLDRIDNDGPYSPENCRWATRHEQARNTRRNVRITHNGKTQTLSAWAEELGIQYGTLRARIFNYHWSISKALTTPIR